MVEEIYFGMVPHAKDHRLLLVIKPVPFVSKIKLYYPVPENYEIIQFLHQDIEQYRLIERDNNLKHLKSNKNYKYDLKKEKI